MSGEHVADLGRSGRDLLDIPACGYTPNPSDPTVPLCNRPAFLHVTPLDRGAKAGWTIYVCQNHAKLVHVADTWDAHTVSPACSHPASMWVRGDAFRVSGCAMPRERVTLAAA